MKSIKMQMIYIGAAIVSVVLFTTISCILFLNFLNSKNSEIISLKNTSILLEQRLSDHLIWVNELQESIIKNKKFSGQVNPKKCKFGKWYHAYLDSELHLSLSNEQKAIFKNMGSLHDGLHKTAKKINGTTKYKIRMNLYNSRTKKYLSQIRKWFSQFIGYNHQAGKEKQALYAKISEYTNVFIYILSTIIISLISSALFYLIKRVSGSIRKIESGVYRLSKGDLKTPLPILKLDCSAERKCGFKDCPCYGRKTSSCFIEVGSYALLVKNDIKCPSILKGKFKDCKECGVMKKLVKDEIGFLIVLIDYFRERIHKVISRAGEMIFHLASATEEMTASLDNFGQNIQNQSAGTEEITGTIEQVSATMENIVQNSSEQHDSISSLFVKMSNLSEMIRVISEQTKDTQLLKESVSEQAKVSESSIVRMNESIGKINSSSSEMTKILKIITGISGQINLLSLNAAIEAARAGEAGRGFAVVSDEISKLADQTSSSIRNIDVLIKSNEAEISKGNGNIEGTINNIKKIIDGVNEISVMIGNIFKNTQDQLIVKDKVSGETEKIKERSDDIRNATREQKIAFDEIMKAITNINDISQNNASAVEELATSSGEISKMTESIKSEVEFFQI